MWRMRSICQTTPEVRILPLRYTVVPAGPLQQIRWGKKDRVGRFRVGPRGNVWEGGRKGSLWLHVLLFPPPIPPQPAYHHQLYLPSAFSNSPYNCSFPFHFPFNSPYPCPSLPLLLLSSLNSLSPPPVSLLGFPTHTFFLSWWKCKHLRQTEVTGQQQKHSKKKAL